MLEPDNPAQAFDSIHAENAQNPQSLESPPPQSPPKAGPGVANRPAAGRVRKAAAKTVAPAGEQPASTDELTPAHAASEQTPPKKAARKAAPRKSSPRKTATASAQADSGTVGEPGGGEATGGETAVAAIAKPVKAAKAAKSTKATKTEAKRPKKAAASDSSDESSESAASGSGAVSQRGVPTVLFVAPSPIEPVTPARKRARKAGADAAAGEPSAAIDAGADSVAPGEDELEDDADDVREVAAEEATGAARRRRRRGRRGRGRTRDDAQDGTDADDEDEDGETGGAPQVVGTDGDSDDGESSSARRRRRRRRAGGGADGDGPDDPPNTVTHVRERRDSGNRDDDGVRGVKGSTRLEAKRQRRRDGRESGRRRPSILSEAEFLARREAVDRVMAVRQRGDRTQIAVLEDDMLVEHYVTRASATSYVGNVYLGRVQNVLPSMEAAFVDIGKGRNGVLYAGEVNWDAAGLEGKARTIEGALNAGDPILVQVTKDPIGHKGARLTSQISLPGRFLVYVPGGGMTGISRKLPDTERQRLKSILKKIVPEDAGVIIRTAAEGASEEELTHDVLRLTQEWEAISAKAAQKKSAPVLLHGEPDLAIRVVRDVFNEDFKQLIVEGEDAWQTISTYIADVAPDLAERVSRHASDVDLFHQLRVDEQLAKALDRKVWLPSGGSLVIDRTEAMTVIDVNTGKYVGSGGNLEQTVTRNNLEAAEEIVRQLRLRDVGGIVVIDFIDMVLESNRDLVLRRLTECLGRDRTKHQVAEVTSLGLVQMTRKRVGEGLLEAFSEPCEVCHGRGVIIHAEPVFGRRGDDADDDAPPRKRSGRRERGGAPNRVVEDLEQIDPQRRRAAASAMAAIHRATAAENGSDELDGIDIDSDIDSDSDLDADSDLIIDADIDIEIADDADDAHEADEAAAIRQSEPGELVAEATELGPVSAPTMREARPAASAQSVEPAPADSADVLAWVSAIETADRAAAAPAATGPAPRRRRGASRPAGPPIGSNSAVGSVELSESAGS